MPDPLGALVSSKGSTGSPETPSVGPRVSSKAPGSGPRNESCSGRLFLFLPPSLLERGCLSSTHPFPRPLGISYGRKTSELWPRPPPFSFLRSGTYSGWGCGGGGFLKILMLDEVDVLSALPRNWECGCYWLTAAPFSGAALGRMGTTSLGEDPPLPRSQ